MGCNAYNHSETCDCGFGGRPEHPPTEREPAVKWRSALGQRRTGCPHCGKGVYFVRGRNGGTFYLNEIAPRWSAKHECAALRRTSRLRVAMSQWRRQGWMPLGIVSVTEGEGGQVVEAISLIDDGAFSFRLLSGAPLSTDAPAFYRIVDELMGTLELDYLSDTTGELQGSAGLGEKLRD